ncbi:MAG: M20/M25/M40 family metallo-hydrolase [bacterium]
MINPNRLKSFFLDMVQINSHGREEKDVALYIKGKLDKLGILSTLDDTGERIGGNCGNLLARVEGPLSKKIPPLLLCAHMDTVVPGKGVKPVEENGEIRSSGDTILGADDKSGIAVVLELLHILKERSIPHGEIEILFTVAEEIGLLGANNFDTSIINSKIAYFLDSVDVSEICVAAPAAYRMTYRVFGQEAHAGISPQKGISAILVAAKAIATMPLGRIDSDTTANIGVIEGGTATNIVPNLVTIRAEARGHDEQKLERQVELMRSSLEQTAAMHHITINGKEIQARIEETRKLEYRSYRISEQGYAYQLPFRAGQELGLQMKPEISGGGSDANIFNARGVESVVLGTGMSNVHTVNEFIRIKDLEDCANLILKMIQLHQ